MAQIHLMRSKKQPSLKQEIPASTKATRKYKLLLTISSMVNIALILYIILTA